MRKSSFARRGAGTAILATLLLTACARRTPVAVGPRVGAARPLLALPDPAPMPGPVLPIGDAFLKIGVCADNIVRVAYARDPAFFARGTLATAAKRCVPTPFTVTDESDGKRVTTATLAVHVAPQGTVSFFEAQAEPGAAPILAERDMGHDLRPQLVWGEPTFTVSQQWDRAPRESLYGLGQHQQDLIDISDADLDLYQHNTEIFIPFLVSSRGYGILWDNPSETRFGDIRPFEPIPAAQLVDADGQAGGRHNRRRMRAVPSIAQCRCTGTGTLAVRFTREKSSPGSQRCRQ